MPIMIAPDVAIHAQSGNLMSDCIGPEIEISPKLLNFPPTLHSIDFSFLNKNSGNDVPVRQVLVVALVA